MVGNEVKEDRVQRDKHRNVDCHIWFSSVNQKGNVETWSKTCTHTKTHIVFMYLVLLFLGLV